MRVIHNDGRTGDAPCLRQESDFGEPELGCAVIWDDGDWRYLSTHNLRPLGPIEEELLKCVPGAMPEAHYGWPDKHPYWCAWEYLGTVRERDEHALSEALQYCREMWLQHGVVV